ncbi:uncharacterized protein LOC144458394 [Epinephelus lanceolatus]
MSTIAPAAVPGSVSTSSVACLEPAVNQHPTAPHRADDDPGPSSTTSWSSVVRRRKKLSLPLFDPPSIPLTNFFSPLASFPPELVSPLSARSAAQVRKRSSPITLPLDSPSSPADSPSSPLAPLGCKRPRLSQSQLGKQSSNHTPSSQPAHLLSAPATAVVTEDVIPDSVSTGSLEPSHLPVGAPVTAVACDDVIPSGDSPDMTSTNPMDCIPTQRVLNNSLTTT